jgi:SnoaL-like domain
VRSAIVAEVDQPIAPEEEPMNEIATTVDTYLAMWNETDPDRRAELIEQAWTANGRYVDPLLEAEGHTALSEMVAAVHGQYPAHRFRRTSGIDTHHDQVRFAWELAAPDGALTVAGIDVGAFGADGRLLQITGFFGDPPEEDTR